MRSDWAVIIKKILMDTPKDIIVTAVFEFGEIKLIKIQLIGMWQKTVVEFAEINQADSLVSKNQFKALLFTLPVGTTVHDLGNLLEKAGEKTCTINRSIEIDNRICCVVVGFASDDDLKSAFHMESIFNGMKLFWARMNLVCCEKCGHFEHLALECDTPDAIMLPLSKRLYKKSASEEVCFWLAKLLLSLGSILFSMSTVSSGLSNHLVVLERFLELLVNQMSKIMKKLSFVELVSLVFKSFVSSLVVLVPLDFVVDSNMAMNNMQTSLILSLVIVVDTVADLSSSSSKVLISKSINVSVKQVDVVHWYVNSGILVSFVTETKLRSSIKPWIANKFESVHIFTLGLEEDFLSAGVTVIMSNSLIQHVSKVEAVLGWVVLVWLLFKGKLSVTVLGLYTGASFSVCFGQVSEMNSIIAKAINSSTFVVLGKDFNKCGSKKSVSFRFCSNLGLVNLFCNSRGVEKTIDYIFVSESLSFSVAKHWVGSVSNFFNMDYNAVVVSVSLEGLLDVQLNSLHKQANKDHWKFRIKDANSVRWSCFRNCSSTKILMVKNRFFATAADHNLDAMWLLLEKALVDSAGEIFFRHWFSVFQYLRNMQSSKFLDLELLVVKIVKTWALLISLVSIVLLRSGHL
ncbi:hypothetical protein G9A89_006308 [Geosiphon pyriformis]|nr:hypothetical protein G9A89_006308 [Geosiphon pyriformis]